MLSKILKKSDCASCRFCCSFRRQSLWETPLFDLETKERLEKKFPSAHFRPAGKNSYTVDLSGGYRTDSPDEEAACPFLDSEKAAFFLRRKSRSTAKSGRCVRLENLPAEKFLSR